MAKQPSKKKTAAPGERPAPSTKKPTKKKPASTVAKEPAAPKVKSGAKGKSIEKPAGKGRTKAASAIASEARHEASHVDAGQGGMDHERVSQRAYEIWLEKGRPHGQEEENWAQAVRELQDGGSRDRSA